MYVRRGNPGSIILFLLYILSILPKLSTSFFNVEKLKSVLQAKLLVITFVEVIENSKPLFVILPTFSNLLVNPLDVGTGKLMSISEVSFLYHSTAPDIRS